MDSVQTPPALDALVRRATQQKEKLAQAAALLYDQRDELARLIDDLKSVDPGSGAVGEEAAFLLEENERLERTVEEKDRQIQELNQLLDEARNAPRPPAAGPAALPAEVAVLKRRLDEKDALIEELRQELEANEAPRPVGNAAEYEAELNDFRRQLEADRQRLDNELRQVRARHSELTEAAREAELEMSRERAQLARERVQLERMRDEFRQELEIAQRGATVQESLSAVRRLKDELAERRELQSGVTPPPPPRDRAPGSARWRSILSGPATPRE